MIRSERQSEPFVRHPKIAVATECDRLGSYRSDFLCNRPDVGLLAAVVREAVVAETIVELTQQYDIVLQPDIRPAPTTARPATITHARGRPAREPGTVGMSQKSPEDTSARLCKNWRPNVGRAAESLPAQMRRQEKVMEM
jgi:hypothetical protein